MFFSCRKKKTIEHLKIEQEDTEIIAAVIDSIAAYDSPRSLWPGPPPQNRIKKTLTREDSLKAKQGTIKYIELFRTIAIDTSLALNLPDYETTKKIIEARDIFATINPSSDSLQKIKIDINKINLKKRKNIIYYDSITYFNPSKHLTKYRSYQGIDYRFNFSKIYYNKDKTHAVIRYLQRYEDRHPNGSGLFLLRKENKNWKIIDGYRFMGY